MTCEHCNGPGQGEGQCCWARAKEIKKFKKKVFRVYIVKIIFEMVISISSVVTDIISLVFYIWNGKWVLAILSAVPVILPTTVFTNVYLSNKHHSYNSLSVQTTSDGASAEKALDEGLQTPQVEPSAEEEHEKCFNFRHCCKGCFLSFCHKDIDIRNRGKGVVKKYLRRSAKYLFGTLVLRIIAWTWYLKALVFGYQAYKSPKKYMKVATPDSHWSYELLTRLDFLQAALENAPQCVIQLYALLTDSSEQRALGVLTLVLSFLDFVRVATEVQWSIIKGPVIAPKGCYGSTLWTLINACSWVLLYSARGSAIALAFATSQSWEVILITVGFVIHMAVFAKLFSSTKFGVAAQKVLVTAFISVFFLPELDSEHVDILIQFYYAALLLENTIFIIPWRGLEYVYCGGFGSSKTKGSSLDSTGSTSSDCLIQPVLVVLMVPAFTVLGIILRIAAARRVARFKSLHPENDDKPMTMEERVASIYNRKWAKLTYRDLFAAFIRMLRKEVSPRDKSAHGQNNDRRNTSSIRSNSILLISGTLGEEIKASQTFIKKSFSMIVRYREELSSAGPKEEKRLTFPRVKDPMLNPFSDLYFKPRHNFLDDKSGEEDKSTLSTVPKSVFAPAYTQNTTTGAPIFRSLEVKFLKVESPEGEIVEFDYLR